MSFEIRMIRCVLVNDVEQYTVKQHQRQRQNQKNKRNNFTEHV